MEVDNEVSGNGNSYTTQFRQYDPRLGRWKSLDPLMAMFPNQSAYCAFDNNPIYYIDPYGLSASTNGEPEKVIHREGSVTGGDRKNRDEILRNMEKVADGTIVKFVYADGEATYTYTIGNDGSGRGLWMGRWEKPADAGEEFDVVGDAGTLRTLGSKMNLGGEVPQLAKAEPPTPELDNSGIDDPDNSVTNQAGQEVETKSEDPIKPVKPVVNKGGGTKTPPSEQEDSHDPPPPRVIRFYSLLKVVRKI